MKLKLNNKCKVLIGSIAFSSILTTLYDVSSLAYSKDMSYLSDISAINRNVRQSENIDITNKSIIKAFGGYNSDIFSSIVETSDGGYITVGESNSANIGFTNKGYNDAIIIKYNKDFEQQWIKNFGGSSSDCFKSVIETSDKGYIAVGESMSSNAGFQHKGGSFDAIIVKYNKDGNQEWIKSFGGNDNDYFSSIIATDDGGFIVAGDSASANAGFGRKGTIDAILVKYNKDGEQQWIKNFGGSAYDDFYSVISTNDSGFITVGYSASTNAGFTNRGENDAIIVKYNKDGEQQWVRNFGGSDNDYFESVVETSDRGYITVGYSESTNAGFTNKGKYDAIMVKYNKDGEQQWIRNFGGSKDEYFNSVIETSDNGYIAIGDSASTNAGFTNKGGRDAILVKYDEDGEQQSIKTFGGSVNDIFYSIIKTPNNGFITVGYSNSAGITENGNSDAIIVKYDDNCKNNESLFLSVNNFDQNITLDENFSSITELSGGGYIAVGGSYSNNIGFDNYGGNDAIIVKYGKNGSQEWIKNFGGSGDDYFNSVVKTNDGGFITAGYSSSVGIDFDNYGGNDAIVVKYDKNGSQEWIKNFGGSNDDGFSSIISTSDGGFVVSGYSHSTNAEFTNRGQRDAIIVKLNSNGTQEWAKNFGGSLYDYFESVEETLDGGFIVVGHSSSTDAGFVNNGKYDAIIVKYDKDGNQEWIKGFGGSNSSLVYISNYDYFMDVITTSDNGFVAVGYSFSTDAGFTNKGYDDGIIVKYDEGGNQEWVKNFGGNEWDEFRSITRDSDGGFIIVGNSTSTNAGFANKGGRDLVIVKYDRDFNQEWVKSFGGSNYDYIYAVIKASDKSIIAVGKSDSDFDDYKNTGGSDALIVKYDNNGNQNWTKSIPIKVRNTQENYNNIRNLINKINNEEIKRYLNEKLNNVPLNLELELKNGSANLDIYIKSENMLLMNLSTNSITFNDYSGLNEIEQQNAVEISINSSLPYQLNAYLLEEMYNNDKTKKIDMDRLQIKDNEDIDYKEFTNINEKLVLKDSCESGNDKSHSIDLKLKGGNAYESDIYKTVIKFEAEQK